MEDAFFTHLCCGAAPPPEIYDFIDDGCCILIAAITQNQLKPASFGWVCRCWLNTPLILTLPETNSELTPENLVVFGVSDPFLLGFYSIFRCFVSLFVLQSSSIIKVFTSNCLANKLECRATQFPIALVTKTLRLCSLRCGQRPNDPTQRCWHVRKLRVVAPHAINCYVIFNLIQVCCCGGGGCGNCSRSSKADLVLVAGTKWQLRLLSDCCCSCDCLIFVVVSWVFTLGWKLNMIFSKWNWIGFFFRDLRISGKDTVWRKSPHTSPASSGSASEIIGEFPERRVVATAPVSFS